MPTMTVKVITKDMLTVGFNRTDINGIIYTFNNVIKIEIGLHNDEYKYIITYMSGNEELIARFETEDYKIIVCEGS